MEMSLERHQIKPALLTIAMELDSTEAIKSAVEAGLGAGFVSKWAIAKDGRTGTSFKVVEIDELRMRREFQWSTPPVLDLKGWCKVPAFCYGACGQDMGLWARGATAQSVILKPQRRAGRFAQTDKRRK